MPDKSARSDLAHGVPPISVSSTSTLANRTGSWKYIRPVYQDRVAPCNAACPVGIDIEACMNLLREGRTDEARALLLRENPMPAVTGRVCEHPCHAACNRRLFDEAVNIRAVERMLGDLEPGPPAPPAARTRREKIAIVGSGPAGLACAYHLARLGYPVTVFEADPEPGGTLRNDIPDYRLPREVLAREIDRIRAQGVAIRCGVLVGGEFPWKRLDSYDAVFVATGARRSPPARLGEAEGADVRPGRRFLRGIKAGERHDVGARVAVLGGTDTAVDCARTALRLGSTAVVLHPGPREEATANARAMEEAVREGVRFEFQARIVKLRTTDEPREGARAQAVQTEYEQGDGYRGPPRLVGLECLRAGAEETEANGPARSGTEGARFVVPADTLLLALHDQPELDFLPRDVPRAGSGIEVDEFGHTARAGLFAGGDLTGEPRSVAHALGSGKRAAIGIDRWLRTRAGESVTGDDPAALRYGRTGNFSITRWRGDDPVYRTNELNEIVTFDMLNMAHFTRTPGLADRHRPPGAPGSGFAEANLGLATEDAMAEARRCFNCGVCNMCELCMIFCPDVAIQRHAGGEGFSLSYKYCKGCGLCVEECPRGAMIMTREGL